MNGGRDPTNSLTLAALSWRRAHAACCWSLRQHWTPLLRRPSIRALLLLPTFLGWPRAAAAVPFAYIANAGSNTVSVLDTATNAVTATVQVGESPRGVAVSHDGTRVYVTTNGGVSVIDTASTSVIATVPARGGMGIAVNPAGTRLYVASGGPILVVDTATNTVTATVGDGNTFHYTESVAVHPDGSRVYASGWFSSGNVAVIDTASNTVIAFVSIEDRGSNSVPATHGLAVHPDGSRVFVAGTSGVSDVGVSIIDAVTNAVTGAVSTGGGCSDVAVHPDGRQIYGACRDPESLVTIDLASNAVVARVPVCLYPGGVAVDPEGAHVFAANTGCDALWVIDTAANAVSHILPLPSGSAPRGIAVGPVCLRDADCDDNNPLPDEIRRDENPSAIWDSVSARIDADRRYDCPFDRARFEVVFHFALPTLY